MPTSQCREPIAHSFPPSLLFFPCLCLSTSVDEFQTWVVVVMMVVMVMACTNRLVWRKTIRALLTHLSCP